MYALPSSEAFKDQFGQALEFAPAPDLRAIADDLIDRHVAFSHLPQMRVEYLWKAAGGTKAGKLTLGKCQRPSGLLGFYSRADFVVWLAWDHVLSLKLDHQQVEAALFHELCHAGRSGEDGETPELWPHDVEMFAAEVRYYGLWRSDLECLRQLGLFERVDRETGEVPDPLSTVVAAATEAINAGVLGPNATASIGPSRAGRTTATTTRPGRPWSAAISAAPSTTTRWRRPPRWVLSSRPRSARRPQARTWHD